MVLHFSDIISDTISYTTDYAYGKNIGNYTLSIETVTSSKYDVNYESGKVTVEQKELSADAFEVSAIDKSYDGNTDVTLTAKVKTECIVKGDNVTADLSGEFDNENAR